MIKLMNLGNRFGNQWDHRLLTLLITQPIVVFKKNTIQKLVILLIPYDILIIYNCIIEFLVLITSHAQQKFNTSKFAKGTVPVIYKKWYSSKCRQPIFRFTPRIILCLFQYPSIFEYTWTEFIILLRYATSNRLHH